MITINLFDPDKFRGVRKPFDVSSLGDFGLSTIFLHSPVRLCIGDAKLFEIRRGVHIELPLLGFALGDWSL